MGEHAVIEEAPRRRSFFAGRSAAAWGFLGALLATLLVLAFAFSPESPRPAAVGDAVFSLSRDLEPFVTLTVDRSSALAAAAAVILAALMAAWRLESRMGRGAPLWVAVFVFGSLAFQAVLWTPAAAIAMAAVAIAFAVAQGGGSPARQQMPQVWDEAGSTRGAGGLLRWIVVGALLGAVGASHPLYLGLLIPAWLHAPALGQRRARMTLLLGAAATLGAGLALGGLDRWLATLGPLVFDVKLAGWNVLYLFLGRHVGLLPWFLPLLLALAGADEERGRFALGLAVVGIAAAFALAVPFDFFGGPSALGNRFFLPLYGAVWLCGARPARAWPALLVTALAGVLLWPLWLRPLAHPLTAEGAARYVGGPVVERLPYELTQRELPGARDVVHHGLRMRFPDPHVWAVGNGETLRLAGDRGELLFAAGPPLGSLLLDFGSGASPRLTLEGGELGETILRPDGDIAYVVTFERPYTVMPGWWSEQPVHWYRLSLRFAETPAAPVAFSIAPQRKPAAAVTR